MVIWFLRSLFTGRKDEMNIISAFVCFSIGFFVVALLMIMWGEVSYRLHRRRMASLLKTWDEEDSKATMLAARSTKVGLGPMGSR